MAKILYEMKQRSWLQRKLLGYCCGAKLDKRLYATGIANLPVTRKPKLAPTKIRELAMAGEQLL